MAIIAGHTSGPMAGFGTFAIGLALSLILAKTPDALGVPSLMSKSKYTGVSYYVALLLGKRRGWSCDRGNLVDPKPNAP